MVQIAEKLDYSIFYSNLPPMLLSSSSVFLLLLLAVAGSAAEIDYGYEALVHDDVWLPASTFTDYPPLPATTSDDDREQPYFADADENSFLSEEMNAIGQQHCSYSSSSTTSPLCSGLNLWHYLWQAQIRSDSSGGALIFFRLKDEPATSPRKKMSMRIKTLRTINSFFKVKRENLYYYYSPVAVVANPDTGMGCLITDDIQTSALMHPHAAQLASAALPNLPNDLLADLETDLNLGFDRLESLSRKFDAAKNPTAISAVQEGMDWLQSQLLSHHRTNLLSEAFTVEVDEDSVFETKEMTKEVREELREVMALISSSLRKIVTNPIRLSSAAAAEEENDDLYSAPGAMMAFFPSSNENDLVSYTPEELNELVLSLEEAPPPLRGPTESTAAPRVTEKSPSSALTVERVLENIFESVPGVSLLHSFLNDLTENPPKLDFLKAIPLEMMDAIEAVLDQVVASLDF